MDIIFMLFAMTSFQPIIDEPPAQPQALTAQVIKLNTDSVDMYNDMWDSNWINKNENGVLQKTRP